MTDQPPISKSGDNVYDQQDEFWEGYIKSRPAIPQSFFDSIFDYHSTHNASFGEAHEVGAGVGVYSHRLSARFKHVLVSDVIATNIDIARKRLSGSQYSFLASSLEDTISLPPESIDLVFASTMMHFTKVDEAVKAVHRQLKPGGTFAAGLYGTYALLDPQAQEVWAKIVLLTCDMIIKQYGLDDRAKMILQNEASGLDSVGLPEELFSPAERYEYNFPRRETMREMILPSKYGLQPISHVRPEDKYTRGIDKGWYSSLDLDGLKAIVNSWPHDSQDPELLELWDDLHDVIGDGKVEGAWMVHLLLATKK